MAGEIGHIIYAARLLTHLGPQVKHPSYWVGTVFPDIRHLGVVSRHRTHPSGVSLKTIVGKNDFHTGLRVHAWIDATREQYLREANIKEALPWHPFVPHALKLMEDARLYHHFEDWNLIQRVLAKVYDDELHYVASAAHIKQWHTILQDYFSAAPTDASRKRLSVAIGLSEHSADELNSVVALLGKNRAAQKLFDGFIAQLEKLFH